MNLGKIIKRIFKILKYILYSFLILILILLVLAFAKPIWHRIVTKFMASFKHFFDIHKISDKTDP